MGLGSHSKWRIQVDLFQYYPTPVHLTKIVWEGFTTPVTRILEPHAGAGDLVIPYLNDFPEDWDERKKSRRSYAPFGKKYWNDVPWDACEINMQMHPALKEAGATIVGCDFFAMQDASAYSHVCLNPPFRDGAKHLCHAWNILYAGEIGCILNASTIRNPSSKEARKVVELIEKYGSVQYLADQFLGEGVERETAVEVAVIHLKKVPESALDIDSILDRLKPDTYTPSEGEFEALNAIALPMNFIERVLLDYTTAVNAARLAAESGAILEAAEVRLGRTFSEMQAEGLDALTRAEPLDVVVAMRNRITSYLYNLRERAWGQVLRSNDVLDKLTTTARRTVESQFKTISMMEFNQANIVAFISGLQEASGELAKGMILEIFDMIIQRDSDNATFYQSWKSNEKHKRMGMRIKKSRFILPLNQHEYSRTSVGCTAASIFRDMDKAFGLLAGQPSSEAEKQKRNQFGLAQAISREMHGLCRGERIKTTWLDVRYYPGKGTFHFFPNSQLMLDKLNKFVGAARQWLPPDMEMANDDFKKQYESAEALQAAYEAKCTRTRNHYGRSRMNYVISSVEKGSLDEESMYHEFADAVAAVHAEQGLTPNNVLTACHQPSANQIAAPTVAITYQSQQRREDECVSNSTDLEPETLKVSDVVEAEASIVETHDVVTVDLRQVEDVQTLAVEDVDFKCCEAPESELKPALQSSPPPASQQLNLLWV